MIFTRFYYEECDYVEIHNEIFPEDPAHIPAVVYKAHKEDGEYFGFWSGYLHDRATFYIQRIGIPERFRNGKLSKKIVTAIWDHLKGEGFKFLMGTIEAKNIPPIIVALKTGWLIHGFRVSSDGTQHIEIIKEL